MRLKSVLAIGLLGLSTVQSAAQPADLLAAVFAADTGETRAVLVVRDGKVTAKRYAAGYSDETRFVSWSMAKTITGALVGELVADGKLSLDTGAPVAEWQGASDPRRTITLRHLLHMASGLRNLEVGDPVEASDTNQTLFVGGTQAMAKRAIAAPLEVKPGTKFNYSSLTTLILSEIVTRTLTRSTDPRVRAQAYRAFVEARLFKPAGIKGAVLDFDGAGTQIGGSLIYMTIDDYGRWGQLMLRGQGVDGSQVIAPDWLAFMTTASPTNAEYGGQTWLNRPGGADGTPALFPAKAPATLFAAQGHLGQRIIVSPQQNLVLVRLGKTQDGSPESKRLLSAMADLVASVPFKG
jgi:CubicO group peptidase (beta-lactamase class C family)